MKRYIGFYIDKPIGNNIFSYEDRSNKKIYVPINCIETFNSNDHNADLMNVISINKMKSNGITVVKKIED